MKKNVLSISHKEKGRKKKGLTINLPEPVAGGDVLIRKKVNSGKGWEASTLSATGIGRVLIHTQYHINKPTTFISQPTEGVVCLHIYVGKGASIGYQGEKTRLELNYGASHVFWQGKNTTESRLSADHELQTVLKLYLRPECLSHLSDRSEIMDIIDQALVEKNGSLDQLKGIYWDEFNMFLFKMLGELKYEKTSVERFHYLCDCLLLLCLGEKIEIEPREETEGDKSEKDKYLDKQCKSCQREQKILSELEGVERTELLDGVYKLQKKRKKLEKKLVKQMILNDKLIKIRKKTLQPIFKKIRDDYMDAAYLFADWYKKDLSKQKKKTLVKGIIGACKQAFRLLRPNRRELVFHEKWCKKYYSPFQLDELDTDEAIVRFLYPDLRELQLIPGDHPEFVEKLKQAIWEGGILESSREEAKDKPKEVVELYQRLMEHFSDTLVIGEDGGIQKSDIVRELDAAYAINDLSRLQEIEMVRLVVNPNYVELQEDNTLRGFIVSLDFMVKDLKLILKEIEVNPKYSNLQLFYRLGENMKKFRRKLKKEQKEIIPLRDEFSTVLKEIKEFPLEKKILQLAEDIVESGSEK